MVTSKTLNGAGVGETDEGVFVKFASVGGGDGGGVIDDAGVGGGGEERGGAGDGGGGDDKEDGCEGGGEGGGVNVSGERVVIMSIACTEMSVVGSSVAPLKMAAGSAATSLKKVVAPESMDVEGNWTVVSTTTLPAFTPTTSTTRLWSSTSLMCEGVAT